MSGTLSITQRPPDEVADEVVRVLPGTHDPVLVHAAIAYFSESRAPRSARARDVPP